MKPKFFGEKPVFSLSMVKYDSTINAFWKITNFPKLNRKEISSVSTGIKAYQTGKGKPKQTEKNKHDRIYHSKFKIDNTYVKYLEGKDVSRYFLSWSGEWIKYGDNIAEPRYSVKFNEPRILVRQIPSNQIYSIEAVYTDEYLINDINSMVISNIRVNPLFLLGVINSKVSTLWFMMKFDKFQRRIYPQFKVNELGEFPIPDSSEDLQNKIARPVQQLMDEMKNKNRDNVLISSLNTQIDERVMNLFQLTDEEKQSIRDFEVW